MATTRLEKLNIREKRNKRKRIFNNTLIITFICIALFSSCLSSKYEINVIEDFKKEGNYTVSNYYSCNDSICYNGGVFCNRPLKINFDKFKIKKDNLIYSGTVEDDRSGDIIPYCSITKGIFNKNNDTIILLEQLSITDTNGKFEINTKVKDKDCIVFYPILGYFARIYEIKKK